MMESPSDAAMPQAIPIQTHKHQPYSSETVQLVSLPMSVPMA